MRETYEIQVFRKMESRKVKHILVAGLASLGGRRTKGKVVRG
jgi:hypothetical protein